MDAAEEMLRVIERLQSSAARTKLPPHNLAVDFPQKSPLGQRAFKLTQRTGAESLGVMCEGPDVLARVREMAASTPDKLRNVGIVLLNYMMHDIRAEERDLFIAEMRAECPDALFLVADYTMREMPSNEAELLFTANMEHQRKSGMTPGHFLEHHRQTTYADLVAMMRYGFSSVRGHRLPAARALVAGAPPVFWTPDLEADWTDEAQIADDSLLPMPTVVVYRGCPSAVGISS